MYILKTQITPHSVLTLLSLFSILLLQSCEKQTDAPKQKQNVQQEQSTSKNILVLEPEQIKNLHLTYTTLQTTDLKSILRLNGKIDIPSQSKISLSIPLSGIVKEFSLSPGQKIQKGQKLVTIQDAHIIELQKEYLLTKNNLQASEVTLKRLRELSVLKATSDKELQDSEFENTNLKIKLNAYQEQLKLIGLSPNSLNEKNIHNSYTIYSPINGFVRQINTNVGKYIGLGDVALELIRNDDIHLVLNAFESDLQYLKVKQKVKVYSLNNNINSFYNAEIISINKSISQNNIVEIHAHIENSDENLVVGTLMYGVVDITLKNVNVLENQTILDMDNKKYVYIKITDNKFQKVEITTGASNNNFTEVKLNNNQKSFELLKRAQIVENDAYYLLMEENK